MTMGVNSLRLKTRTMTMGVNFSLEASIGAHQGKMPPSHRYLFFVFLPLLAILLQTPKSTSNSTRFWYDCPTTTNYTANSTFQSNLNHLLTNLPAAAAASSGFSNDTVGQAPYQVNGLALCRGDVSSDVCRTCLDEAAQEVTNLCQRGTRSTVCYDECLLRYSTENFFSSVDTSFDLKWFVDPNNATNQQAFATLLENLMDELTTEARDSPDLFAAKSANATGLKTVYGLVQCTRDLSPGDCYRCLRLLVNYIPDCCDGKKGAKLYLQSCCVRYESFPFYNIFAVMARQPPPALLPSPPPPPANSTLINGGKSNNSGRTLLFILIPAVAAVVVFLAAIFIYCRKKKSATPKRKHVRRLAEHQNKQEITSVESLLFDLQVIKIATDNFSETNKLGEGGFGSVYKGTLENGEQIAVKRLARSSEQGLVELKNEVVLLAKLQHRNLVKLLGCCIEPSEELLVYECLPNTSLDKFLFDPIKREQLDWAVRFKIIKGISRGLLYLHEDSRLKIIHRDLKASNVLLDQDMNPKISDFGIAKLFGVDETHKNTIRIAGTYGYMAPEYAIHGLFSIKSDVYSYGVLVLEILTGLKNSIYQGSGNYVHLVDHVWRHWHQGKDLQVIDQKLMDHCEAQEVLKCLHIGLLCVQEDATQRPSMASVIHMLNSHSVSVPTLSAPAALVDQNGSEMN